MKASRTLLAAIGDVNDIRTWSGTPYHLLQAARSVGVIDSGLVLKPAESGRQRRRYVWNLFQLLRGRGKGGYQFSDPCLSRLWQPLLDDLVGCRVVNCFQLYPQAVLDDPRIEKWFYIDQTMFHYLTGYGLGTDISPATQRDILRRERDNYAAAKGVICHSRWAARSVIEDCGVPAEKVHVVVPGANLDPAVYARWQAHRETASPGMAGPLKLVFVGKAPLRKGLDRLIRALVLARQAGADCTLRVIGCTPDALPPDLREVAGIEWRGFIHKQQDADEYLQAVADCDVGCLLSYAEAGGMCLREFHALGLAVIAPDVGGSPDHALDAAACLVGPAASNTEIADLLIRLARDRALVQTMQAASWAQRARMQWPASVQGLARLWSGTP